MRRKGIDLTPDTMRAIILSAERTRNSVAGMRSARMFDDAVLMPELVKAQDYKQARMFHTVPVVAAWEAIMDVAAKQGYDFRVSAHDPRNPEHTPRADEESILSQMEKENLPEYFAVSEKANEIFYARPIEESIAKSNAGGAKLQQVASTIHAITESASKVKVLVEEVSRGTEKQASGAEQISQAIHQMGRVTQSNAASSEETAAASQQVAAQAESMSAIARELLAVVAE
jgi:hypothetical protein